MGDQDKPKESAAKRTPVGWRLSIGLKSRIGEQARWQRTQIEVLVEQWLEEKVTQAETKRRGEERKQALRILGITERDLPKPPER